MALNLLVITRNLFSIEMLRNLIRTCGKNFNAKNSPMSYNPMYRRHQNFKNCWVLVPFVYSLRKLSIYFIVDFSFKCIHYVVDYFIIIAQPLVFFCICKSITFASRIASILSFSYFLFLFLFLFCFSLSMMRFDHKLAPLVCTHLLNQMCCCLRPNSIIIPFFPVFFISTIFISQQ